MRFLTRLALGVALGVALEDQWSAFGRGSDNGCEKFTNRQIIRSVFLKDFREGAMGSPGHSRPVDGLVFPASFDYILRDGQTRRLNSSATLSHMSAPGRSMQTRAAMVSLYACAAHTATECIN